LGPEDITEVGYNYRMNELQAILIRVQMNSLEELISRRLELVERYRRNLSKVKEIEIPDIAPNTKPSYYAFSILVNSTIRDRVRHDLLEEEIETSVLYNPVHLQPAYAQHKQYGFGNLPITERVCSRLVSLPLSPSFSEDEVDFVCQKLTEILEHLHSEFGLA
jgi:dTDP-4-amino-4,6-dideoxygalactose transaminase